MFTRKEMERLRSDKIQISKVDPTLRSNSYLVCMVLTTGELLSIKNALESNTTFVGADVLAYLNNALDRAKETL